MYHRFRQKQRDLGENDQQHRADRHGRPEQQDTEKDIAHGHTVGDAFDHENIQPQRWTYQAHLKHHDQQHAEPDRIVGRPVIACPEYTFAGNDQPEGVVGHKNSIK